MQVKRRYTDLVLYQRLLLEARPFWVHLTALFLLGLLQAPLMLLMPVPLKIAVDNILGEQHLPEMIQSFLPAFIRDSSAGLLMAAVFLVIGLNLLLYLRGLADWLLQTYTGEKLILNFRSKLFRHLQRLSFSYHDSKGTADSVYRIQYDTYAVQQFAIGGLIPLIALSVTVMSMIYITTCIDWQLALVAIAITPLLLLVTAMYRNQMRERWSEAMEYQSSAMSVVQEVLGAVRVVKAFGQEEREHERFIRKSRKGVHGQMRVAWLGGGFDLLVGLILAAGTASVLFLGVLNVQSERLTLGSLLMVMAYLTQLYAPLEKISKNLANLQSALASAERVYSVLDQSPEVKEKAYARPVARAEGHFLCSNISFGYNLERRVLHDLSFEIHARNRVGISGTTGSGKTTLTSLLMRFFDPQEGFIALDGIDLRDYKLADLRNQFSLVLQEPVLFSASLAENIAYAKSNAGEDEIIKAAKAAHAHDFIDKLPQGYKTQVGDRGMSLSGGERQRISLARAFLKDAPILILDEPTSAVDQVTEALILDAMEHLMRNRTAFIITHRESTLRHCDILLKLESGRLLSAEPAAGVESKILG